MCSSSCAQRTLVSDAFYYAYPTRCSWAMVIPRNLLQVLVAKKYTEVVLLHLSAASVTYCPMILSHWLSRKGSWKESSTNLLGSFFPALHVLLKVVQP